MAIELDINTVIENLSELLTNSVNLTNKYYDLFINPEPLDVELELYNEENELVTVTVPNRAKDKQQIPNYNDITTVSAASGATQYEYTAPYNCACYATYKGTLSINNNTIGTNSVDNVSPMLIALETGTKLKWTGTGGNFSLIVIKLVSPSIEE